MEQVSTIHAFFETAQRLGARTAIRQRVAGRWKETPWSEYARLVRQAARALIHLGVAPGGAVVILGPNRPEWVVADLGAIAAGAVPAPIYPTLTARDTAYIAAHSEATVAVVYDATAVEKLRSQKEALPKLAHFVVMEGSADGALCWSEFLALGEQTPEAELDARLAGLTADGVATLIYTSGTTGQPKAVMITHGNLLFIGRSNRGQQGIQADERDHLLSYLPLSHIAEQVLTIHGAAVVGYSVSFCEKLTELADHLREARPTIFFGVPRVWEKLEAKMREAGAASPWLRKKIAAWARDLGLRGGRAEMRGEGKPLGYGLASKLVFSKVRERLGLDRARFCASGAAAISQSTLEFFLSLGIPIYEVFGQSENCGPATINQPGAVRLTSVGRPLPGTEVKLAEDGEILVRGPHVFKGYFKDPENTAQALPSGPPGEGPWLHTGDIGEIDRDGYLKITDRKKDLFKTSGGKYIAPQAIENQLKAVPGVALAVVIGDARKYCTALLTLDPESAAREAVACGASGRAPGELAGDAKFLAHVGAGVERVNAGLAQYETIKKFKVLPVDFSIDGGELTPTMKVKRKVVAERYKKEIDSLYE